MKELAWGQEQRRLVAESQHRCAWCGEWLDYDNSAVLTEFGDMHYDCVDDAREHYNHGIVGETDER